VLLYVVLYLLLNERYEIYLLKSVYFFSTVQGTCIDFEGYFHSTFAFVLRDQLFTKQKTEPRN
jgi:hypothetical protein